MPHTLASSRRPNLPSEEEFPEISPDSLPAAAWQSVVHDSVKSIRFGVVQIVIHDSRVVQIERTERTRFDLPHATARR